MNTLPFLKKYERKKRIMEQHKKIEYKGRKAPLSQKLINEWDYKKNYPLIPEDVSAGMSKKVWWICANGHSYEAKICNRTNDTNCPYCSGRKAIKGVNDLLTTHPDIVKEWDYKKNNHLIPTDISAGSSKKAWWICPSKHSYEASIYRRANGANCPYCSGHKTIKGVNDLATVHPAIAKEWDYKKNYPLIPENFASFSNKKAWWCCSEGHSYDAQIRSRSLGNNCPYCAGKKVLKGFNDLATIRPDTAKKWDYEKNYPLTPENVTAFSNKKVWWICSEGHSYDAQINYRPKGTGCPYCSGHKPIKGVNDLLTTHPDIVKEWDYKKNNHLIPTDISAGSGQKVWWVCAEGHSYKTSICDHIRGNNCPYCAGKKVLKGFNDLATIRPDIAKEWDYEKNYPLTPENVTAFSNKKVWWICSEGHSSLSTISNRSLGRGCPYCKIRKSEKLIGTLLDRFGISYKTQVTFLGCKNKQSLFYDYQIEDFRFASFLIERQGEQHERPVDFAGKGKEWAKEQFESNQRRDKIKVDFCQETGRILEFIWYYEDTEEALINLLRKHIKPEYNLDEILNTTREQVA